MQNKNTAIAISVLMILSIAASMTLVTAQVYPPPGTHVPAYAQINVAPNPIGRGQTVTVNMYLAVPLETSARPENMTLYITDPNGVQTKYGPFTGDVTGGTYYAFAPDLLGNYSIYWYYPGQTLTGRTSPSGFGGLITDPSTSKTITLTVQEEPVSRSSYPITPLPTSWWETPVTAENIQEWYKITGPWLGLGSQPFASTGGMAISDSFGDLVCNPYTSDVLSGHVIWTLPWGAGGVPGGIYGGTESSNYWMTRQYSPNFAAVIINGIIYSDLYTYGKSTGAMEGIVAVNLFTGERLFTINTTNALVCGMEFQFKNPNQYGVVGPFLWTTGTLPAGDTGGSRPVNVGSQWNMYDAVNGNYIGSIVNGTGASGGFGGGLMKAQDEQGGMVGYYVNNTAGSEVVYPSGGGIGSTANRVAVVPYVATNTGPHLDCFNFTTALGAGGLNFQPNRNFVIDWRSGVQFQAPIATNISGVTIAPPALSIMSAYDGVVCLTTGYGHGNVASGWEQEGWLVFDGMDMVDGHQLMLKNVTQADTAVLEPWSRVDQTTGDGKVFLFSGFNEKGVCYDLRTGDKVWGDIQLTAVEGYEINPYDVFNWRSMYANGIIISQGFGGDMWAVNATTGEQMWAQNTVNVMGDPGIETPYGTWPLWVFAAQAQSANVAYFGTGHEYDPPLFHGAQLLALNMTDGSLIFKTLGYYTREMAIAYGVFITVNEYSNEVFAFAKGPTGITVSAPSVGVTTETPITISGRITDVSPGTKESEVALNYPYGVPAVSEESQSAFMETVYQQQPMPHNVTGVPIDLFVLDANNNYRQIGTTTSDYLGTYTFTWTPDIPGDYTVYANFVGSNSYWPTSASTGFHAGTAATAAPTQAPPQGFATSNDLWTGIAVIAVVIIIVGAVLGVLLRRRP